MARRQGATKEHILHGSGTQEQRRRRAIFIATLRAGGPLAFFRVARSGSPERFRGSHFSRVLKNIKILAGKCKAI